MLATVHLCATAWMAGLIWFVQIVHYPLFARVGAAEFPAYEVAHQRLTSFVVIPAMLTELITAGWLLADRPNDVAAWVGAGLVAVIWASTFALQVPLHARLSRGYDAASATKLVRTNWFRTVAWTARLPVSILLLARG